ncbi:MAG: hypothetical protein VYE22_38225 [Myxococcota bacterium]|nr:hypothetical protein [Myxococcota bacterium]
MTIRHTLNRALVSLASCLFVAGCAAETGEGAAPLTDDRLEGVFDPFDDVPPAYRPFDAGVDSGARDDIPGRDDDFTENEDVDYGSFNPRLPMRCQTESDDRCPEGYICCHNTMECVPETCPDCCTAEDYHRSPSVDRLDVTELPEPPIAGPRPPEDDGRDGVPPTPPPREGGTPGPMPTGPGD